LLAVFEAGVFFTTIDFLLVVFFTLAFLLYGLADFKPVFLAFIFLLACFVFGDLESVFFLATSLNESLAPFVKLKKKIY